MSRRTLLHTPAADAGAEASADLPLNVLAER
jgi:hypothetical protein